MEHGENSPLSALTPDQAAVVRLIDRALKEGVIREDQLQPYLNRLELAPEAVAELYRQLTAESIRVVPGVEEPVYTDEETELILNLLLEAGDRLSERAWRILILRFLEGKTLEETAQIMGLTRERIRQIESKSIRQMRPRIHRRKKIQDFYK